MSTEQFDQRYRLPPCRVENPGLRKRREFVLRQTQESLSRIPQRPANIAYFEKAVNAEAGSDNRPGIGFFCNMIPIEIIVALGGRPVRLDCGNAALVQTGEEVLAGDICPLVKASFASLLAPGGPAGNCLAFLMPSSCDAKRKLGEILADYKPTFLFNLPPEQDAGRYLKSVTAELERLIAFLSKVLNRKLRKKELLAAISQNRQRTQVVRELQAARAAQPAALSIRDFFVIIQASFSGVELNEWCSQANLVLEELRHFQAKQNPAGPGPRLVLTGAPMLWPNFKILSLIEECGADVVADTLCSGAQSYYDPVVVDETGYKALLRALGMKYVFASACPCFSSQATRLSRVLELVAEFNADGVVNHGLRLCQLFDMEAYRLDNILKNKGIPFLNLRTDYSLEDTEQLRTRLEAFLETVEKS